ncbi:MAG TPA: DUF202 domain-containing protein [Nocardiopsis listeri]|uniref:DUF202 domain-containing protein n=1 Tax=Nocardiopsis listeri TaxID=53440 RepID=UPI001DE8FE17|nr:DUF202 domain-containing protein [Nocardiopsis listeri]HJE58774.1 DUF202 domain-containing protein [Nocardiopsis listeri]
MIRRDPGLQPERTLLSWQRTLILLVLVGLLYLRGPFVPGAGVDPEVPMPLRVGVMALTLLMCAGLGLHLWLRWRRTEHGMREEGGAGPPPSVARPWALILLCAGVFALTVAVAATVIVP